MTQEKMRKVITACVSAATVLLVLLLSFLIYQWVTISVLNKRIAEAEAEVAYWEEIVAKGEEDERYFGSEEFYKQALIELQLLQEKNQ
jgi:hypothetical protein